MPELHETQMGRKVLQGDIPEIRDALKKIAKELKRLADMQENLYLENKQKEN